MSDNDLDETGMFIQPKPIKKRKAYGSNSYVCWEHKGGAGVSVMSFGHCTACNSDISSHCGGLPKLCDGCSIRLNKCRYCLIDVVK